MRIYNIIKSNIHLTTFIALIGVSAACNVEDINSYLDTNTLSGSVGDGPVTEAQVSAKDATGSIVGLAVSNETASYSIEVTGNSRYPVVLTAVGGTDTVTGSEPDFAMMSAATNSSVDTVNINPFTTLIVKTAQAMPGGLTATNLSTATGYIVNKLGFGLDPALVPDPITTVIDETNVAAIVKASEALGEAIRRTRAALLVTGVDIDENAIIDAIASDMTDGVLDGLGNSNNTLYSPLIAATANVVSAQVLVEALENKLNVGNADATVLMDNAIKLTMPSTNVTTSDVVITKGMLTQASTAVAAAQAFNPNSTLAALAVALAALPGNNLASDIETLLPTDSSTVFNEFITQIPLADDTQLEAINSVVREGKSLNSNTGNGNTDTGGNTGSGNTGTGGNSGGGSTDTGGNTGGNVTSDTTAPVITLLGSNPLTLTVGSTYTEAGAKATDNVDGDISSSIVIDKSAVNTNVVGSYLVVYKVSDSAGNSATPVVRTVKVVASSSARPWEDLVTQVVGFGKNTTGGKGGAVCWVSNLNATGSGSLRDCVSKSGPQWIRFSVSGTINLTMDIFVQNGNGDKTIDGRGQDITLSGAGIVIANASNVIIENIKITNGRVDGIRANKNAKNVWIDHVTISNPADEKIDISDAATDVTVSWTKFQGSGKGILISSGATFSGDAVIRVTMHHNYFYQNTERHPLARWGKVHMFNNYIDGWGQSAAYARTNVKLLSENNIWRSGNGKVKDAILRSPNANDPLPPASVVSRGELALDTVNFLPDLNPQNIFNPRDWYSYTLDVANTTLMNNIANNAGWRKVAAP